ncbi:MAG TPA: ThiF family adenylyltransferase, partial [Rhodanobacter sp.]|nr:ThiF family adenylyltransferase [Rhodanobacter sp.]
MSESSFPHERFAGVERLYGAGSVAKLAQRHVCVVGVGGVGSWAAEALVRSGVG